jgi:FMN reductase [NAD(P)H]
MDFADVLRRRKAVRSYLDEPIPRETLERIVARGRRVPSGGFSQGLRLVVVTDAAVRRRIGELAGETEYVAMGFDPWISRAPVHIVIGTREEDYHDRYREPDKLTDDGTEIHWPVPYWHVDAGAAMMLLMLAAVDEGLAAGVFGALDWKPIWELLGIPDDVLPVAVVTVGKPAPETRSRSSRKRGWKPLDEVVRWERW